MDELRLVLIGRTGAGKSSTGNNILDKRVFLSTASGVSVTRKCERGCGARAGVRVEVVDTPGLFDTSLSQEDISREIVKCFAMAAPGPHAFLLVIRVDRFTCEEQTTVDQVLQVFGEGLLDYLTVVFTRKDDLINDGKSIDQFVQNAPAALQKLLRSCNYRYVAFDNHGTDTERRQDVENLITRVRETVRVNGGGFYTSEMFEEAERALQVREAQIRREKEERAEQQRQEIEEECRQQMAAIEENEREMTEPMKTTLSRLERDETSCESDTEVRKLRREIADLKAMLGDLRREADQAKAQTQRDATQRRDTCVVQTEEPRQLVRQEVNSASDVIMSILKFLESDTVKPIVAAVVGALASGLSGAVTEGFKKLSGNTTEETTKGKTNSDGQTSAKDAQKSPKEPDVD